MRLSTSHREAPAIAPGFSFCETPLYRFLLGCLPRPSTRPRLPHPRNLCEVLRPALRRGLPALRAEDGSRGRLEKLVGQGDSGGQKLVRASGAAFRQYSGGEKGLGFGYEIPKRAEVSTAGWLAHASTLPVVV